MIVPLKNYGLSTVCHEVPQGADVSDLVKRMRIAMKHGKGIGLAANQIGYAQRVIIVDVDGFREVFVNPVLVKMYGGKHTAREGCLSFPGENVLITRHRQIIVEGFTPDWRPLRYKLKGLVARCIQHEVDHLNGITIQDYKQ